MNASPNMDSVTAHFEGDVVHWLTNGTRDERFLDNIIAELCIRLQRADIPVKRASLHLLIYHPQWLGGWRHQARQWNRVGARMAETRGFILIPSVTPSGR